MSTLTIYRISQTERDGYDTYDSAVVIAETSELAQHTHPRDGALFPHGSWKDDAWASKPTNVQVEIVGVTCYMGFQSRGVVCASFNAG